MKKEINKSESGNKLKLSFFGGAESVTGANFMLQSFDPDAKTILVDCGLHQGSKVCDDANRLDFAYDPKTVDVLFVTHAHLDHIGRIPKLVRDGFRGVIYSTPPTKDMAQLSLIDSLGVMEKESRHDNQEIFYEEEDVKQAMSLWQTLDYHQPLAIGEFTAVLRDAGHILGSAMVELTYARKKIVFTGDLGNSPAPLLRDTEAVSDADYLIMESVYGDRNHEERDERKHKLRQIIHDTMKAGGTLMVPAFSIERTQELLFEIENMMEAGEIPEVPVFLDSPLAIGITAIYKRYKNYLNRNVNMIDVSGDGVFKFPHLRLTKKTAESRAINSVPPRKIIIAGSGMSNGGRIIHHEKRYLPDAKNTLLLIGYQAAGSLGRQLSDGAGSVNILGETVSVNARIAQVRGYSAHKDSDNLLEFVSHSAETLKKVFVVMGEPKSSLFLTQRIRDYLGLDAVAPSLGAVYDLDLEE
ncbi:MAG: MBL fold metallo-hydrolase [Candidatus Paceibacterota bacterium]